MNEVLLVTCHKDSGGGIAVLDLNTCTPASQNFKNCIADAGTSCLVGGGATSFSGVGSSGDYVAVAQSQKPAIHIYQWGKPQPLYQCHIQEITTALASDHSGRYIVGGSKKGWIYLWELSSGALIRSWQAHFKAVTCLQFTRCGTFLVSASDDGMARAWDLTELVDTYSSSALTGALGDRKAKSVTPFRSWSPHTLAVKGVCIMGGASPAQNIRAMTCSTDRTIVMYDIHAAKQVNNPLVSFLSVQ
jgi:pre-rRNA-processing protein IPI3